MELFAHLQEIVEKPQPFEYYTTPQLWDDPHVSKGMLDAHLDPSHDAASYRKEFIDRAVEWMAARFDISQETRICDFGCGPGLYTTAFAERGAVVTGIDLSRRSISYARDVAARRELSIEYILQNYLEFSTDRTYDLITMISCDFPVLSPGQRRRLLGTFHTILAENGAILLDVDSMKRFAAASEGTAYKFYPEGGFWSAEPHHVFENAFKYEQEKVLLEKYTIVERDRTRNIFNWHQCYSLQSLQALFGENGLQVEACYSNIAGDRYDDGSTVIAVVAVKSA